MHLYMSGTPRNDPYQSVENRLCTHRLFSMHGEYEKAVMRWVSDLKQGILSTEDYLKAYPQHYDNIRKRDVKRRYEAKLKGRTSDWDTTDVLSSVCKRLDGRPYPKAILLDSGAFTAWNKGETTTVDDVRRKYASFINQADDLFDEIWGINLDVIPGEKGRDPTEDELKRAVEVSDVNFEILVKEFGDIILPVFHQGESWDRLDECVAQVAGKSEYICVSPRNDLAENMRVAWSYEAHEVLRKRHPKIMTHGLATTGNKMVSTVPWYSGDSAAWVQHGGFGMIDIFHSGKAATGRKNMPHYMNYFVSLEGTVIDLGGRFLTKDGTVSTPEELLGINPADYHDDNPFSADALLPFVESPDDLPFTGGHYHTANKSYWDASMKSEPQVREYIRERVESLGFPFDLCLWDSRVRNLICMAEFVTFAESIPKPEPAPEPISLGDW